MSQYDIVLEGKCTVKKKGNRGTLVFKEKLTLRGGLFRDGVIWKVPVSHRYPNGVRYRLAVIDVEADRLVTLFDNHHPKGHHRHFEDGREEPYAFESVGKLVEDYLAESVREERKHED